MKLKTFIIALGTLFLSAVSCTHDNSIIDLSGKWDTPIGVCTLPGTTDESHLGEYGLDSLNTSRLGRPWSYEGKLTYTRQINVPAKYAGRPVRIFLERTKPSSLSIDGKYIGSVRQLYAPHVYEIPGLSAGTHTLELTIDNSKTAVPTEIQSSHAWGESTQSNWNGVVGRMYLEFLEPLRIEKLDIYPDAESLTATVRLDVYSEVKGSATVKLRAAQGMQLKEQIYLSEGLNSLHYNIGLGENAKLWSEFHPNMHNVKADITSDAGHDSETLAFGIRTFKADGSQFSINGVKTFLRGKHDACVFPLTGYAPMDVDSWRKVYRIAKEYGINHYRFHSWTPPEAAFAAADLEGIYLQPELPLWGPVMRKNVELNEFMLNEARTMLEAFGHHPSFVMFGIGNELHGEPDFMGEWLDSFRAQDPRHLYCNGSNNNLGWLGPQEGEDFFVACRVGWGEGFSTHVRTSFGFVDADEGGLLNRDRPNTTYDYAQAIAKSPVPVVGHETCQFQSYPDFAQIEKYKGVLYPYNLEIFRSRMEEKGLAPQAKKFVDASTDFALQCYKADMEYALRTPGFGGFQLLDLQDYPGQGSALVGVLDAFLDRKSGVTPQRFREFCDELTVLASFEDYCLRQGESLTADLMLANFTEHDFTGSVQYRAIAEESGEILGSGQIEANVKQGATDRMGTIDIALKPSDKAYTIRLLLKAEDSDHHRNTNHYTLWAYPETSMKTPEVYTTLSPELKALMEQGGKAILVPKWKDIAQSSVGGLFTPDYWCYSMFKTISEGAGKPVSPGTLCMLFNDNSLNALYPNDGHSGMQCWSVAKNSRPLCLDMLSHDYIPIVQVIDNVERNHKLGILCEFKVGKGSLLLCTTDLEAIRQYPEGASYVAAVADYFNSESFHPDFAITWDELQHLLTSPLDGNDIQGVRNVTDYTDIP